MRDKASEPPRLCRCGCGGTTTNLYRRGHNRKRYHTPYVLTDCGYDTPCWVWGMKVARDGYAREWEDGKLRLAHRLSYERHIGPIPPGLTLDHLCRNRACINPAHLEPVTQGENVRRGMLTKLGPEVAAAIRGSTEPTPVLAERYGVHANTIRSVRSGRTWS